MTIIVNDTVKTINIYIDNAASDDELTFHIEADASMAVLNIEDIRTEETT